MGCSQSTPDLCQIQTKTLRGSLKVLEEKGLCADLEYFRNLVPHYSNYLLKFKGNMVTGEITVSVGCDYAARSRYMERDYHHLALHVMASGLLDRHQVCILRSDAKRLEGLLLDFESEKRDDPIIPG